MKIALNVNGMTRELDVPRRTTLLTALRDDLGLTGTRYGCGAGQCGACFVMVDGRAVASCLMPVDQAAGAAITTIEGLARGDQLHPLQEAFIAEDGLQCGYCTPGQIMSAAGLLSEGHAQSDADIREQMSGNICRCGAYTNIVAAIQRAKTKKVKDWKPEMGGKGVYGGPGEIPDGTEWVFMGWDNSMHPVPEGVVVVGPAEPVPVEH